MSEPTQTIEGWYALHDFRTIHWRAWKTASPQERNLALREWTELSASWRLCHTKRASSYGIYAIAGHKADLLFLHFRPTLEELITCKTQFNKTGLANFMEASSSYVSMVELSSYLARPGVDPHEDPRLQARLQPNLEYGEHICFYPMNKRREGDDNWYMLPVAERTEFMKGHGMIGRNYADRVTQIITGSVGFDDWEWGVTLFAKDPLQFKKLVYEMRFDEASARFGEFGPFCVGRAMGDEDVTKLLLL